MKKNEIQTWRWEHELAAVRFPEYFLCSIIVAPAISEVQLSPQAISIDIVYNHMYFTVELSTDP